jgi:AcrR family transcriptional regulator
MSGNAISIIENERTSNRLKKTVPDRRVQRTRDALFAAFFDLVLARRYEELTVETIVKRARVGRSTFYEHFCSKDAMLAASLAGPFGLLADAILPPDNTSRLVELLDHFWANRAVARGIFAGAVRRRTTAVLTGLIEQRMKAKNAGISNRLIIPTHLAAVQLSEALLAPMTAWLLGESVCSAKLLAVALRRSAIASVEALSEAKKLR